MEFVSLDQTVNQHFHHKVLERLRKRVASVKPFIREMDAAPRQGT